MRGFLAGVLGLLFLQAVVASREGPDRAAGLAGLAGELAARFLNPAVPALPDRRVAGA